MAAQLSTNLIEILQGALQRLGTTTPEVDAVMLYNAIKSYLSENDAALTAEGVRKFKPRRVDA